MSANHYSVRGHSIHTSLGSRRVVVLRVVRWLALHRISAWGGRVCLARRPRAHGVLMVVVLRRVRHGRLQQGLVISAGLDELFVQLGKVVWQTYVSPVVVSRPRSEARLEKQDDAPFF